MCVDQANLTDTEAIVDIFNRDFTTGLIILGIEDLKVKRNLSPPKD